ncbi:MAG: swr complex subunit [Cirrosporium novae-zelandiae]|nr:MAG: swr complex subunit [Cirrosporium novae-zelandiae]
MATPAKIQDPIIDEDSDSSLDEDFNPDAPTVVAAEEDVSSEDEGAKPARKGRKRKSDEGLGDLDSGDEVTIQKGKKRRKRKTAKNEGDDDDAEGGLIKTRAMRAREDEGRQQKRIEASIKASSLNVDDIWSLMISKPLGRPRLPTLPSQYLANPSDPHLIDGVPVPNAKYPYEEETITITRTYNFAGQTTTETKVVPKSSAEARLYLQQLEEEKQKNKKNAEGSSDDPTSNRPPLRRPLKRLSQYDPNPSGQIKGLPPSTYSLKLLKLHGLPIPFAPTTALATAAAETKAQKLTVVEKSKLDWAEHVDHEGIREELDAQEKAKGSYLSRMEFMGRVEGRKEEELRRERMKKK